MTFNLLMGGEERFSAQIRMLAQHRPDVLMLQECLHWEDGQRLGQLSEALELPHAHLLKARPRGSGNCYHGALLSRLPIAELTVYHNPAWQGHFLAEFELLWGERRLRGFTSHFDSHNENLRFVEARFVASRIEAGAFHSGDYFLGGDLNSLSPLDPYPADLEALLRENLITKYHLPPRFEVMEELANFGWRDGLHLRPLRRWATSPRKGIDLRTDYLLFSPKLAESVAECEVLPLAGESDHAPVLAMLA